MSESGFINELGLPLVGFIICFALIYITSLVFAVREYRMWDFSFSILLACGLLIVAVPFIWLIVAYAVRRRLYDLNADKRLVSLKLALGWAVTIGTIAANGICQLFCLHTIDDVFASEIGLCCSLSCSLLFMIFAIWMNGKLNVLLISRKSGQDS